MDPYIDMLSEGGKVWPQVGEVVGALTGEVVRRAAGSSIQQVFEQRVRAPYGLDFYLGLPQSQEARYLPVQPMLLTAGQRHHRRRGHPRRRARRRRARPGEGVLGVREFPAAAAGYAQLLGWLRNFGTVALVGVEGPAATGRPWPGTWPANRLPG